MRANKSGGGESTLTRGAGKRKKRRRRRKEEQQQPSIAPRVKKEDRKRKELRRGLPGHKQGGQGTSLPVPFLPHLPRACLRQRKETGTGSGTVVQQGRAREGGREGADALALRLSHLLLHLLLFLLLL